MYQALYRKYRPVDFKSVVGQDSVVKTLKNSIIHNNFSHAYLFYGSRGTGKTSLSKIFARSVNCLGPVDGDACGKCDACKISFSKECIDIIEIDAASNNGVDEIRELKNNVMLVPTDLKYKVYIIDEVHMLSDSAFNALLKTLEEPPEHIIFVLATTDPQKVPETIVSRCQCFAFKRISEEAICNRLNFICQNENIKIDDDVIKKISLLSDGGLRDALGSLDKLVSYTDDKITMDIFNDINGIISDSDIHSFISSIFSGNISDVLSNISRYSSSGKNFVQIIIQIIDICRNDIVSYYLNGIELEYPVEFYQNLVFLLNEKMFDMKRSGNLKIYFEILLLKYIDEFIKKSSTNMDLSSSVVDEKILTKEEKTSSNQSSSVKVNVFEHSNEVVDKDIEDVSLSKPVENINVSTIPKILNIKEVNEIRINNTFSSADKSLLKIELNNYELLRDFSFDQDVGYLVNSILDSKIRAVGKNDLIISYETDGLVEQNLNNIVKINEIYNKITNSNKKIAIVSDLEWDSLKDDYIKKIKNKYIFEYKDEPELLFEETKKDDIIVNSAISLFGDDVVEIE